MSLYLIDTSALARVTDSRVREVLRQLILNRSAATCVTVDLESGFSARNADDWQKITRRRDMDFRALPMSEAIADRAREVQYLLAQAGLHRSAGIVDVMTAAIAEHHGATVLHYDADFEHIAGVTGQAHRWVVPRGSI